MGDRPGCPCAVTVGMYQALPISALPLPISFDPNTQMIARGKNASDLFPAVVKNVACKNIEVSITQK